MYSVYLAHRVIAELVESRKIARVNKILSVTNELEGGKESIVDKGDIQFGRGWRGHSSVEKSVS